MDSKEAKAIIEALVFASDRPIPIEHIKAVLDDFSVEEILALVEELKGEYNHGGRGIIIEEVAGGLHMVTNPHCAQYLDKLFAWRHKDKLSQAALETLAIIAYRQPVTRTEIEAIRGVNVDSVIGSLLERGFIKIVGRKEVVGRPFVYGTTREFLERFGLNSVKELPPLRELTEAEINPEVEALISKVKEPDGLKGIEKEN